MIGTWITKEGSHIAYNKLELSHLKNIIKLIEKKAKEGEDYFVGGGSDGDYFGDMETLFGEDIFEKYDYYNLKEELNKREEA